MSLYSRLEQRLQTQSDDAGPVRGTYTTAAEFWRRGMRALALDTLSPDDTGADAGAFPVHEIVLGGDGLIVENLCGLGKLSQLERVGFSPLKLQGDGAPIRAVAF